MNELQSIKQKLLERANELSSTKKSKPNSKKKLDDNIDETEKTTETINKKYTQNVELLQQKRDEYYKKKRDERDAMKTAILVEKQEKLKKKLEKEIEKENPQLKEKVNKIKANDKIENKIEKVEKVEKVETPIKIDTKPVVSNINNDSKPIVEAPKMNIVEPPKAPAYRYPTKRSNYFDPFGFNNF